MAFRYDNPALDLLRAGPPLIATGIATMKQLYDYYTASEIKQLMTDFNMLAPKNSSAMVQQRLKRKSSGSRSSYSKRPIKRQKTQYSKFQSTGKVKEKRWVDIPSTVTPFNTTNQATLLNGLVLGTDYYHRLGHNYVNTSINFRGHITPNATLAAADILGIAIVYDRQANGAAPGWNDVFDNTPSSGATLTGPLAQVNIQNSDRFLILLHETKMMPSLTVTAGVTSGLGYINPCQDTAINLYKQFKLPTRCDGDTAAIADIISGSIYLIVLGSNATTGWNLSYNNRIRFEL